MVSSQDISNYIDLVLLNNPTGLKFLMDANGIDTKEPKDALTSLYLADKQAFYKIMKGVNYNSKANNITTSMNFHRKMKEALKSVKNNEKK